MSWRAYVFDTMTGLIRCPIDLPSFSWTVSVSDSTLSTTRDKGVGEQEATGLRLPWGAIPATTAAGRSDLLCPDKRSIMLCWSTSADMSDIGVPVVGGVITPRTDTASDTSFTLESPLGLLSSRYIIDEDKYGANGLATDVLRPRGLSYRGLACWNGQRATGAKAAGQLPIDWSYSGEAGGSDRDYHAYDIQNLDYKSFLDRLTNLLGGPDCQFRPYLADSQHFRWRFLAGANGNPLLSGPTRRMSYHPMGGSIENLEVTHTGPVHRVYVTGAGTGAKMKAAMAEDYTLLRRGDPWPLREMAVSDNDVNDVNQLKSYAKAKLSANGRPLMQIKGDVFGRDTDANGTPMNPPGSFWPGQPFQLAIDGFPTIPDNVYSTRLMEVSGDETDRMTLTFDIMHDPLY